MNSCLNERFCRFDDSAEFFPSGRKSAAAAERGDPSGEADADRDDDDAIGAVVAELVAPACVAGAPVPAEPGVGPDDVPAPVACVIPEAAAEVVAAHGSSRAAGPG